MGQGEQPSCPPALLLGGSQGAPKTRPAAPHKKPPHRKSCLSHPSDTPRRQAAEEGAPSAKGEDPGEEPLPSEPILPHMEKPFRAPGNEGPGYPHHSQTGPRKAASSLRGNSGQAGSGPGKTAEGLPSQCTEPLQGDTVKGPPGEENASGGSPALPAPS